MSTSLAELADALETDDRATVLELEAVVTGYFERRRDVERAYSRLASTLRTSAGAANSTAEDYLTTVAEATTARATLAGSMLGYIGSETPAAEVLADLEPVVDAHAAVDSARESLIAGSRGSAVGPVLAVLAPSQVEVPRGTSVTVEVEVLSVGPNSVTSVAVSATDVAGLVARPTSIDSLVSNASALVEVGGVPTESGGLRVSARTTDTGDSARIYVNVVPKGTYVDQALTHLTGLRETTEAISLSGGTGNGPSKSGSGPVRGLLEKLDAVKRKVEQARDRLDSPNARPANNHLEAAINQLNAFGNQVSALRNSGRLSEADGVLLSRSSAATIGAIENAIEADPA